LIIADSNHQIGEFDNASEVALDPQGIVVYVAGCSLARGDRGGYSIFYQRQFETD
jgi:hypothetical protein